MGYTYVLSDVHGQLDCFESVLAKINLQPDDTLYVLGDVIDRGAHGIAILRKIMAMPNARMLLGNHEFMMLNALGEPYDGKRRNVSDSCELWYGKGGKTAVDISGGKNLVGAFYQPQLVLCDTETLSTLTPEFFADGMAEVVKYGMIKSRELFDLLTEKDVQENLEDIITRCVSIKAKVVENDERDTGERMVLNFGHTLGHAIEKYYNYTGISHGYAVAIGMSTFTHIAEKKGMCESGMSEKLDALLKKCHLPLTTKAPLDVLFGYSIGDKKRDSSGISIVLCPEIGKSGGYPMSIEEYKAFLDV